MSHVPAKRINDSVLGFLERPALAWMALRMPPGVTPNHLTAVGLCGALLTFAGYAASSVSLGWLWLATAGIVLNWAGDSLDGTLARLRRIERPRFGFYIDHTSDLCAQVLIFLGLGLSPCARFEVACLALITFLVAFVYTMIYAQVRETFRITYHGFGPTEIRALLVAGNLLTLAFGVVDLGAALPGLSRLGTVTIYELVIAPLCVVTALGLLVMAVREARRLSQEDPHRTPGPATIEK